MAATDRMLRVLMTAAHRLLRATWFVRRPRTLGAHAIALTPGGRVIFVRLRYASGWRVPGGGRRADEEPAAAVLRELREEIGMIDHGEVRLACELEERVDFKRDVAALLIVRDVTYRPRWSLEVEAVAEFTLDDLPGDTAPSTLRWIARIREWL